MRATLGFGHWKLVLLLAGAAFLGWRIVAGAFGDLHARSDPETALFWNGNQSEALLKLSEQRFRGNSPADLSAAAELSRQAIEADPLASGALDILGLVAERQKQPTKADAIMRLAAARAPRDLIAQAWLYDRSMKAADFDSAVAALDTLLRGHEDMADKMDKAILALLAHPNAAQAFAG